MLKCRHRRERMNCRLYERILTSKPKHAITSLQRWEYRAGKQRKIEIRERAGVPHPTRRSHLNASRTSQGTWACARLRSGSAGTGLMICRLEYRHKTTSRMIRIFGRRHPNQFMTAKLVWGRTRESKDSKTNTTRNACDWSMKSSLWTQLISHHPTTSHLRNKGRFTFQSRTTLRSTTLDKLSDRAVKLNKNSKKNRSVEFQSEATVLRTDRRFTIRRSGMRSLCTCLWQLRLMKTSKRVVPWLNQSYIKQMKRRSSR